MSRVIIIGNGPAGISAALYTKRAGIDTLIIGKDNGSLQKAHLVENYYGLVNPIKGNDLINIGINQAKTLGCEVIEDEVMAITYTDKFQVITNMNQYEADAVLLATGTSRSAPKLKGLTEFEGKGVSYCAVCDAFFYRGKNVAVLGNGDYAVHEAKELSAVVSSVTILTNSEEMKASVPDNIKLDTRKISAIEGENVVNKIVFEDNSFLDISGVFVAVGVASSTALARKIGAETNGNSIIANKNMETNIPGLYAAGDCIGGLLQISKAVSDGAIAGTEMIKFLRKN